MLYFVQMFLTQMLRSKVKRHLFVIWKNLQHAAIACRFAYDFFWPLEYPFFDIIKTPKEVSKDTLAATIRLTRGAQ